MDDGAEVVGARPRWLDVDLEHPKQQFWVSAFNGLMLDGGSRRIGQVQSLAGSGGP
jgi:hypothetical protein